MTRSGLLSLPDSSSLFRNQAKRWRLFHYFSGPHHPVWVSGLNDSDRGDLSSQVLLLSPGTTLRPLVHCRQPFRQFSCEEWAVAGLRENTKMRRMWTCLQTGRIQQRGSSWRQSYQTGWVPTPSINLIQQLTPNFLPHHQAINLLLISLILLLPLLLLIWVTLRGFNGDYGVENKISPATPWCHNWNF